MEELVEQETTKEVDVQEIDSSLKKPFLEMTKIQRKRHLDQLLNEVRYKSSFDRNRQGASRRSRLRRNKMVLDDLYIPKE